MSEPKRIQMRRTKGWRKPEGAVYVGRPTIFGNPFPVDVYGPEGAVDKFRRLLTGRMSAREMSESSTCIDWSLVAVRHLMLDQMFIRLAGHDLACWCKPGQPCHADVLLELANTPGARP